MLNYSKKLKEKNEDQAKRHQHLQTRNRKLRQIRKTAMFCEDIHCCIDLFLNLQLIKTIITVKTKHYSIETNHLLNSYYYTGITETTGSTNILLTFILPYY